MRAHIVIMPVASAALGGEEINTASYVGGQLRRRL
jgi:hypothetical protein